MIMLDTSVILQVAWIVEVFRGEGGKVKPFYHAKSVTREGRGV